MSFKNLDNTLQKAIVWQFVFLILTTPLLWMEINSELFELPKMFLVYLLTGSLTTTYIARMVVRGELIWRKHWFNKLIYFFLLSQIISTVFSIHPHTSIFGYPTRLHQGLLATISYTLLYFIFINNLKLDNIKKIIGSGIASLFISSMVAFPEHFGFALSCGLIEFDSATPFLQKFIADCWQQDIVSRIFGTFGQPNWLAAFIVTLLPFAWAKLINTPASERSKQILLSVFSSISFATLLFTKSRSGLLALAVGFGLFVLLYIFKNFFKSRLKNHNENRDIISLIFPRSLLLTTFTIVIPLILFGSPVSPSVLELINSGSNEIQPAEQSQAYIPLIERGGTESGQIRQIVWKGAIDVFLHNFVVGSGVETFAYSYYNFRPVEHNQVSEWDFLYNKAHNEFLNFAATTGLLGIISYLSLLLSSVYLAIKYIFKNKDENNIGIMMASIAGLTGMGVSNFFGFSTVMISVWLYLIFGAIVFLHLKVKESAKEIDFAALNIKKKLGLGFIIFVFFGFGILLYRYYYADILFAKGTMAESDNDLTNAIIYYQRAIELSPSESRFYNDYADALSKASIAFVQDENSDAAIRFAQQSILASARTLELNPVHINYYKGQAGVLIRLSSVFPTLLEDAKKIMEYGQLLAPTDAKLMYNIGLTDLDLEATDSAQIQFEKAVKNRPSYEEARLELAQIYEAKNMLEEARAQYLFILEYIAPQNSIAKKALERIETKLQKQS